MPPSSRSERATSTNVSGALAFPGPPAQTASESTALSIVERTHHAPPARRHRRRPRREHRRHPARRGGHPGPPAHPLRERTRPPVDRTGARGRLAAGGDRTGPGRRGRGAPLRARFALPGRHLARRAARHRAGRPGRGGEGGGAGDLPREPLLLRAGARHDRRGDPADGDPRQAGRAHRPARRPPRQRHRHGERGGRRLLRPPGAHLPRRRADGPGRARRPPDPRGRLPGPAPLLDLRARPRGSDDPRRRPRGPLGAGAARTDRRATDPARAGHRVRRRRRSPGPPARHDPGLGDDRARPGPHRHPRTGRAVLPVHRPVRDELRGQRDRPRPRPDPHPEAARRTVDWWRGQDSAGGRMAS